MILGIRFTWVASNRISRTLGSLHGLPPGVGRSPSGCVGSRHIFCEPLQAGENGLDRRGVFLTHIVEYNTICIFFVHNTPRYPMLSLPFSPSGIS